MAFQKTRMAFGDNPKGRGHGSDSHKGLQAQGRWRGIRVVPLFFRQSSAFTYFYLKTPWEQLSLFQIGIQNPLPTKTHHHLRTIKRGCFVDSPCDLPPKVSAPIEFNTRLSDTLLGLCQAIRRGGGWWRSMGPNRRVVTLLKGEQ